MTRLIHTITFTILFQILPSTPMTYQMPYKGQVWVNWWNGEITRINPK